MRPNDIERLSESVVPGTGTPHIQPVSQGLRYATYRVIRNGCTYSLRVAIEHPIDRREDLSWEARVLDAAGRAGLAPPLLYRDPERGVLVSRWVAGRSWGLEEARSGANIERLAGLLRRVHELQVAAPARLMSPRAWVDCYAAALARSPSRLEPQLRAAAASHLDDLAALPGAAGALCHSDLHALNLLERDHALILLDWEYAHVSDPLWDLAGWSANNDFAAEAQRSLLANYLGTVPAMRLWARFRHLLWLYDYICLLWSQLYLSLQPAKPALARRATQLDARLRVPAHYSIIDPAPER